MDYFDAPRVVQRSRGGHFAYSRFAIPSWILIILGFLCLILGFVDIGWTTSKYGDGCVEAPSAYFDPCAANHIYSYISAAIWGGLITMGAGFVGLMMTPKRLQYDSGWLYYVFVGLCLLVFLIISPAIVVLYALELALNDETFFNSDVNGSLSSVDDTKFALPIVLALLGGVIFMVSVSAAMIGCFCRPVMSQLPREKIYGSRPPPSRESIYYVDEPRYAERPRREVVMYDTPRPRQQVVERIVERPRRSTYDEYDYGDYGSRYGYSDFRPSRAIAY